MPSEKFEACAHDDPDSGGLCPEMPANHTGQRVVIGHGDGVISEGGSLCAEVPRDGQPLAGK